MNKHIENPNRCVVVPPTQELTYCGLVVSIGECVDPTEYKGKDVCEVCHDDYHEFCAMLPCGDDL